MLNYFKKCVNIFFATYFGTLGQDNFCKYCHYQCQLIKLIFRKCECASRKISEETYHILKAHDWPCYVKRKPDFSFTKNLIGRFLFNHLPPLRIRNFMGKSWFNKQDSINKSCAFKCLPFQEGHLKTQDTI